MIMVQDGHPLSETKTPIGNHVHVDYPAGAFGDLLRCFISIHDGFEKINYVCKKNKWGFNYIDAPDSHKINLELFNNLENFYSLFKEQYPNLQNKRIAWKTYHSNLNKIIPGHSLVSVTWIDNKVFKWNYDYYNLLRQTDHKIIFVILSPYSSYKDLYLKRHTLTSKENNEEIHLKIWEENYLTFEYPKHKLNYELEINNLLDKDEETYYNLTKFLDVKPLKNWKEYIEKFKYEVIES